MAKVLTLLSLLFFTACASSTKATVEENNKQKLEEAAQNILGNKIKYIPNTTKSYMLCTATKTEYNVSRIVFLIYDLSKDEVIYQSTEQIRKVSWQSEKEVRADLITGIPVVESSNDFYVYNVETKKKESAPRINRE